jgi:enamine deaminase RidA (YjgF/YER057c/UK114 family)
MSGKELEHAWLTNHGPNPLAFAVDGGGDRGPLLFTGTITPHDPTTGALISGSTSLPSEAAVAVASARFGTNLRDVPTDAARAQTWAIYRWLAELLDRNGSDLSQLVRQRLYFRDLKDVAAVERMMDVILPGAKPTTTIVQMPSYGVDERIRVVLDAVAVESDSSWDRTDVVVEGVTESDRYPQAIRVGPLVFVGNTVGTNPKNGQLVNSLADLDPPDFPWTARRRSEEQILAQTLATFTNLASVLETQGATLSDIIKVNGWMSFLMEDYRSVGEARQALYPSGTSVPASSSVTMAGNLPEGALISYEAIALAPGHADYQHSSVAGPSGMSTVYTAVRQAGPYVFTCGDVPIDTESPAVITDPEHLAGEARHIAFGRLDQSRVQVQAWDVYERHAQSLGLHNSSFDDVVHQTVYMRDPAQYPALERVAAELYGGRIPPTSLVPIADTSPYWEADIEIELVAFAAAERP